MKTVQNVTSVENAWIIVRSILVCVKKSSHLQRFPKLILTNFVLLVYVLKNCMLKKTEH